MTDCSKVEMIKITIIDQHMNENLFNLLNHFKRKLYYTMSIAVWPVCIICKLFNLLYCCYLLGHNMYSECMVDGLK